MKQWSRFWKGSTKKRKQRKYRFNAPLHIKKRLLGAHLSKELRTKYQSRSLVVIKGDKVKIMRGSYKGKEGKVEQVNTKYNSIMVSGIEVTKKDGNKTKPLINASNVMIIELNLDDKNRVKKIKLEEKNGKKSS